MNDINAYKEQLFSFNNPLFFAIILSIAIITVSVIIYLKIIYPMQKKFIAESQRYLLEKAELMALFAEMDPDPLFRINGSGEIVHTNESARKLFSELRLTRTNIAVIIPSFKDEAKKNPDDFIDTINGRVFNIIVKHEEKLGFSNIYFHDITDIKEYERKLESYKSSLVNLSAELDKRYENLKSDISSDLHDDIGQKMIVIKLKLSQPEKYPAEEVLKDVDSVYNTIRNLSHSLAPLNISNLGIELTLQSIVKNVSQVAGITGSVEVYKEDDTVDVHLEPDIEKCLLSTAQEALSNIVKHSQATRFLITLTYEGSRAVLIISDNGIGINEDLDKLYTANKQGIGLFRMRERIQNLGGEFVIASAPEYKSNIIAKLPKKFEKI
jgi:signal transduction histidine kinase